MAQREDPQQAERDAHQKSKPASAAPHYLRCEWYNGTERCRLSEGHGGDHEYLKPKGD